MTRKRSASAAAKTLYGPTISYPDGRVVHGEPVPIEAVLRQFEHLDAEARSSFLCIIAHDLTVVTRTVVYDPPVTDAGVERIKIINECLHQLTSCVNPRHRWTAHDEAELIRSIVADSFEYAFDWAVGRAIAVAAAKLMQPQITAE